MSIKSNSVGTNVKSSQDEHFSISRNVILYGKEEELPDSIELHAGYLSMSFGNGELDKIRIGNTEVIHQIYVAVRDENWQTIVPNFTNLHIEKKDNSFEIEFMAQHKDQEIDYCWDGKISGSEDGTIRFTMDGIANSTFMRTRIGFCVLHSIKDCVGKPCLIKKTNSNQEERIFPSDIKTDQFFGEFNALSYEVVKGVDAEIEFTGDIFEMEDQRNWTDASFKTYSTPLRLPWPVEVQKGRKITQSVQLKLSGTPSPEDVVKNQSKNCISLTHHHVGKLPKIGLCLPDTLNNMTKVEISRLKSLNLFHVRYDLDLKAANCIALFKTALQQASSLSLPMELAIHLNDDTDDNLVKLSNEIESKSAIDRILIYHENYWSTPKEIVIKIRELFKDKLQELKIGSGGKYGYVELSRHKPSLKESDFFYYSITPQMHAYDNASLIETLSVQAETIKNAKKFSGNVPITITPVTLLPNRYFESNNLEIKSERLPSTVDVRQMSLFNAVWTLGSLKYIAESQVDSATYFETLGWKGIMESNTGSLLPKIFKSIPGSVYPVYHVFADLGEYERGEVFKVNSNNPLTVNGLLLEKKQKRRIMLANFSPKIESIEITNIKTNANCFVKTLNEENVQDAMQMPESFRKLHGVEHPIINNHLEIDLKPYSYTRIDF